MSSRKRRLSISNVESPPRKKESIGLPDQTDKIVPTYDGFQLIGDSQLLRFAETLLHKQRITENGLAFLGFCVSGHKIHDLLDRIRRRDVYKHVSSEVVLMIGTNDLLQETEVEQMCAGIESLIFELLRKCRVEKLIVLTIPPVPRLRYEKDHWDRLNCYNDFVRSFDKRNGVVHVVDAYTAFMKPSSPLSVLHGTEKCSTKRRDASSTVKIGCESHIKKEPEEFGQMTPKKRKSIEKGREKSTKRGKMFSSPSKEQNSNDSDDQDDRDNDTDEQNDSDNGVDDLDSRNNEVDDHDDRDGSRDDSILLNNNHNLIRENLFEKEYYNGKKDEIHLNRDGLLVIQRLVKNLIDSIRLG